ncbi:hypothetical protein AHAS_Ahas03G0195900 [Arachis hypogaea]
MVASHSDISLTPGSYCDISLTLPDAHSGTSDLNLSTSMLLQLMDSLSSNIYAYFETALHLDLQCMFIAWHKQEVIVQVFLDIKVCAITKSISQAFTYAEAMNRHGSGRQDTRIDLELKDVTIFLFPPQ